MDAPGSYAIKNKAYCAHHVTRDQQDNDDGDQVGEVIDESTPHIFHRRHYHYNQAGGESHRPLGDHQHADQRKDAKENSYQPSQPAPQGAPEALHVFGRHQILRLPAQWLEFIVGQGLHALEAPGNQKPRQQQQQYRDAGQPRSGNQPDQRLGGIHLVKELQQSANIFRRFCCLRIDYLGSYVSFKLFGITHGSSCQFVIGLTVIAQSLAFPAQRASVKAVSRRSLQPPRALELISHATASEFEHLLPSSDILPTF